MSASDFQTASREVARESAADHLGIVDEIAAHVARLGRKPLRVLDAGAGRALRLKLPTDARIVGIDISSDALDAHTGLSERIIGDLQKYQFADASFDIIVCVDVLEHLDQPLWALLNLKRALAPGGLLVIGGPNVWSPKSLVTKITPHSFHVFAYQRLLHVPDAGRAGHPPFPTYLRLAASPRRLVKASDMLGLRTLMLRFYSTGVENRLPLTLRLPWKALNKFAGLLFARARAGDTDFFLVVEAPPE
jgi:SAM-dependent methyltransferase